MGLNKKEKSIYWKKYGEKYRSNKAKIMEEASGGRWWLKAYFEISEYENRIARGNIKPKIKNDKDYNE